MGLLRAVPQRGSSAQEYGGYLYVALEDPAVPGARVTGRLPGGLAAQVEWGTETPFSGTVDYQANRGGIELQFVVGGIAGSAGKGGADRPKKEGLRARWKAEVERVKVDPETALAVEGRRPKVGVIAPATGVALQDVRA